MIDRKKLKFNVITKPKKDLYTIIQANAKFKSLNDVIRTKVGINNFYNFSIAINSSIVVRDIILNSQFVSGWARSTQVLNNTDSKFASYSFINKTQDETNAWVKMMEKLELAGHSMDNMRSLIFIGAITDYAISIDLLHLIYLIIVLENISSTTKDANLRNELKFFVRKFNALLTKYDVNYNDFKTQMLDDALYDFPVIDTSKNIDIANITKEEVYHISAVYSVIGQIWRHRTLIKQYDSDTYKNLIKKSKKLTATYDFSKIEMHNDIAELIKIQTSNAKSIYDLCQGSIIPIKFTGTVGAIYKTLCQRTCFINDSPQFSDVFKQFSNKFPNLPLLPPCKLNTTESNKCYVGYVNESRIRGEEKTQICCPIYAKSKNYLDVFNKSKTSKKVKWYCDNLIGWSKILNNE